MAISERLMQDAPLEYSTEAPDWSSGRYLNYAGRTVKYQDIVNMTNMDVARNSTMVGLSRLGPALMAVPHPATKMIGGFATVAGMAYDGLKLFSRLHSEKDNNAFWAEYNEALKEVGSQGPVQRAVTDFAIGANFVSGQSLPTELAPIGGVPAVLGSFANLAAVGVFGTASFIGGSAISMGMNDAHTRIGMGEELGGAVRSGFSRGIAAGATGAVFLGVMPYITRYLGGKMVDNEIALGFMSTPMRKQVVTRGVAATAGAIDFAGWGVSDYYTNNAMRSYLGLKPTEEEMSPVAIAGMVAMGGFFNGALKSKTLEYLLEKAAGKKSAIQTVKETIGNRYFQDVTTPERQQELLNIQAGRDLPMGGKQVRGMLIEGPLSKVQERLLEAESGVRPFGKSVEQIIMERSGVPKKLTTPEQVDKLGGAEAVLRNTLSDDLAVARALDEIATANRLVSQAKEYELSSQAFATERTGASKVTDTFIPDADGVAKKVRIVEPETITLYHAGKSELSTESIRVGNPDNLFSKKKGFLDINYGGLYTAPSAEQALSWRPRASHMTEIKIKSGSKIVRKSDLSLEDEKYIGASSHRISAGAAERLKSLGVDILEYGSKERQNYVIVNKDAIESVFSKKIPSHIQETVKIGASKVTDTFIPDADGVAKKVRIIPPQEEFEIYPLHKPLPEHLSEVKEKMTQIGSPVIRVIDLGEGEYFALQGVHRLNSAKELGIRPILKKHSYETLKNVDVTEPKWSDIDMPGYTFGQLVDRMRENKPIVFKNEVTKIVENVVPSHIKKAIGKKVGTSAIVSGLIYINLGNDQWNIAETQWLTPPQSQRVAELARNEYRVSHNRQDALNKAMNSLSDTYALNPDNYKMVYDRFMKLTGGYA
jgi:hypothetical protein